MKESLKSTETFLSAKLESLVWCTVQLKGRDMLVVGVIYRSPSASESQNCLLNTMITEMLEKKHSHVMILGDFNYPDINWELETCVASL